jgi:hypothetical protein
VSGRRDQGDPRLRAAAEVIIDEGGSLMTDVDEEPTAEPSVDDRRELARKLAERARQQAQQAKQGLAARAASRPLSAKEALEAARRAEREKKELAELSVRETKRLQEEQRQRALEAERRRQDEERRAADEARRRAEREAREAAEQMERDRQAASRPAAAPKRRPIQVAETTGPITSPLEALLVEGRVNAMLEALGSDVEVVETYQRFAIDVVSPLWRAHSVRARYDGDLTTTIACEAVYEALTHRPGTVVAARVAFGGREWAVWMDTSRDRILAALEPAELYLVGC